MLIAAKKEIKARQAWLVNPGKFEIRETLLSLARDEILLKVEVCGLCNWELNHWRGLLGPYPQTLGHEVGGTVVCCGDEVPKDYVMPGQRVAGLVAMTGFSDYAVVKYNKCIKIDDNIPLDEALAEPLTCVVTTLRGAGPEAGDIGVVVGCGPMGLWCIQGLAGNSLARLIAVDLDDSKLALAKKFGATDTINPSQIKNVTEFIQSVSDGHMADFVIEGTGQPRVLDSCVDYLRIGRGRLILMSSHEEPCTYFDWRKAQKGIEIRVTHPPYSLNQIDDLRRAGLLLSKNVFNSKEIVTHRFSFVDILQAFNALDKKPQGYLKGIVIF